jgi:Tfp pilus assembly protein PilN
VDVACGARAESPRLDRTVLIEINLAPGGAAPRVRSRRSPTLSLPSLPALGGDGKTYLSIGAGVLLLGLMLFGYWRMGQRQVELTEGIEEQLADSARFASTIALVNSLQARQDTVTQKIGVIRSVDTRRYVWPHLLDEISLAVPAYTWLTQITSTEPTDSLETGPAFTVQGSAGSTQAMTRFMKNLETSAFVEGVTLITSEQEIVEGRTIQRFSLEARYSEPDAAAVEMVPFVVLE